MQLKGNTAVSDHISNCDICRNKNITVKNFETFKKSVEINLRL